MENSLWQGEVIVCCGRSRLFHEVYGGRGFSNNHYDQNNKLVYDTIFCRYGLLTKIVPDNGTQFDNTKFRRFCDDHKVQKGFSIVARLQINRKVEVVNKALKSNQKTMLESYKGA